MPPLINLVRLIACLGLLCICLASTSASQTIAPQEANTAAPTQGESVTWSNVARSVWNDQRRIWILPKRLYRRDVLKGAVIVTGLTAGLVSVDALVSSNFRHNPRFAAFDSVLSGRNTSLMMTAFPVSLYSAALIRKDRYGVETALLAAEAILDGEIVTSVMKNIDRRMQPIAVSRRDDFKGAWFADRGFSLGGAGSFPSGHAVAAFSIATVFARRYPGHRWAPYAGYGLAGAIALSRITLLSHYGSDVFLGAALGISISRFVVLR